MRRDRRRDRARVTRERHLLLPAPPLRQIRFDLDHVGATAYTVKRKTYKWIESSCHCGIKVDA
eukprot:8677842-Pyramimonas_sp.AAC.1